MHPALLLLALLRIQSGVPAPDPRAVARAATLAVEGDSVSRVAARLAAEVRTDVANPAVLLGLGHLARLTYDYPRAEQYFLRIISEVPPGEWSVAARLGLAASAAAQGNFASADMLYAAADTEAAAAGDTPSRIEALLGRAATQARLVNPRAALQQVARADSLAPAGEDSELGASLLCARAQHEVALAVPGSGLVARRGFLMATRHGNRRLAASCLHTGARDIYRMGYQNGALARLDTVATLQRLTRDRSALAATLQWRGFIQSSLGSYGVAREILDSAVAEGRAARNASAVGWASLNLAQIALVFASADAARLHGAVAESIFVRHGDRVGRATLRSVDVGLARMRGDTGAARAALTRALAETSNLGGVWPISFQRAFAGFHRSVGDWDAAERDLNAARAGARAIGMVGYDLSLDYDFGVLALKRGDLKAAERYLRLSVDWTGPEQHSFRYPSLLRLAEVHLAQGRVAQAEALVLEATDSLDVWRSSLDDRSLRLEVFAVRAEDLDPDIGLPGIIAGLARGGREGTAFHLAERRRARLLLERLVKAEATRPDAQPVPQAVSPRAGWRGVTHQDVSAALPDDSTAVLEYVTGAAEAPTTLFVITRNMFRAFRLAPLDSLAPDLARFNAFVETRSDAARLGQRLGSALLGAALEVLPAAVRRLILVPDGPLHGLPFDAVRLPDGRYLIERYAVTTVPSAAVLVRLLAKPAPAGDVRMLAYGNPRLRDTAAGRAETVTYQAAFAGNGGLPPLDGAAREARAVARYAGHSEVRLGARATEEFLKEAPLASYRVLHFATHALVDDHSASRTALALAATDGEDGFVGPADLAARRLDADLVVLSACRSARGVLVGGEGVQGLTAPLLEAGARAVVATAWAVGDRSTPEFVRTFYDELAAGRTVGDALHAAKLEAMSRGLPPRSWAAFTLVGNPMVRVPLQKPGPALPLTPVVTGVATLALVGVALLVRRRRVSAG
jgi:tetratricopeptide (TPR) repeat protein